MNEATERLRQRLGRPEAFELVMGYFAEVGGDPEEYGLFLQQEGRDFSSVTEDEAASALRIYFEMNAQHGLLEADVAAAVQSGTVDWRSVLEIVNSTAWAPPNLA
jgi:hypothetical protein